MSGWGPKTGGGSSVPSIPGNTPGPDVGISIYDEALSVPNSIETNIISWIVPAAVTHILRIEFGGKNIAQYKLKFGATIQAKKETYFGAPLYASWEFSVSGGGGVQVTSGTVVRVSVLHNRPQAADFWSRIQYLEIS